MRQPVAGALQVKKGGGARRRRPVVLDQVQACVSTSTTAAFSLWTVV